MSIVLGEKEFFKGIGKIKYEGLQSDNPLSYRWYDETKVVAGKTMKDWLRFAVAYWHSFVGNGADPFGEPTHIYPWNEKLDAIARAKDKADAAFEFITKLGLPYYCFHDVDVVDYTSDVNENDMRLQTLTTYLKEKQKAKYTYGLLEKQFRKTFEEAARRKGVTGENLIKLLEARLDNTVFRLGIAPSRQAARQMVSHKHITVNGEIVNIPSFSCKPGDIVGIKIKSAANGSITSAVRGKNPKFSWLDWNEQDMKGTFIAYPERESVPENIKEQLIVELYSK